MMKSVFIFCLLIVAAHCWQPNIWPLPRLWTNGTDVYTLQSAGFVFKATNPSPDLTAAFARFTETFFPHESSASGINGVTVAVTNVAVPLQLYIDETYSLTVKGNQISVQATTVYGAYHALETLSQLIVFDFDTETYKIANGPWVITDAPRFSHRGVLIDTSRHFQPVPAIKHLIQSLTYAKINVLHWHLVDEQAFPFDSPSLPDLASKGAYSSQERYTVSDVASVVEFARLRGIRVMVEIDTPGHAASWCKGHPEVCPSPDCPSPLNPATNATFDLLSTLFNDLTSGKRGTGLFPENLMHLGGDEVDTSCWTRTPSVAQWLAANNLTADQGYMYFVNRAQAIAHGQGRDVVGWEEIWNHFGTALDKSTIIHLWLTGSTVAPTATSNGYRVIWSVDGVWYLDGLSVTWQKMYSAEPCTGVTDDACTNLVLGGEGCMWGETVDISDLEQTVWPRLGAIAERLWSPRTITSLTDAEPRYASFRCLLDRRGVAAAPYGNTNARTAPGGPGGCLLQ